MHLLVLNYEYPPLGGGAGEITKNISGNIAAAGHQVTVITTWFDGLMEDEILNGVRVIRLRSRRKTLYQSDVFEMQSWILKSKSFLNGFVKNEKVEFCLANFALPGGAVAFQLKKKFNIPYAVLSHGHDIPWFFKSEMFLYHLLTFFRIRKICNASFFNFVQTMAMKENIDKFLPLALSHKNICIPNGIDKSVFLPDPTKRNEKIRILYCGRLVKQKDPFTFLKALKILMDGEGNDLEVLIGGDGPMRPGMEEFVERNRMSDVVTFSGWIGRDQLIVEYQRANIYVQTSGYEAMSMAVMEALACGAFVICTPVGSNQTVIRDGYNGTFTEIGNHITLAEKIKTALVQFSSDNKWIAPSDTLQEWKDISAEYLVYFRQALSE